MFAGTTPLVSLVIYFFLFVIPLALIAIPFILAFDPETRFEDGGGVWTIKPPNVHRLPVSEEPDERKPDEFYAQQVDEEVGPLVLMDIMRRDRRPQPPSRTAA